MRTDSPHPPRNATHPVWLILLSLALASVTGAVTGCRSAVMTTSEALSLPQPQADARLYYADHPSGFGDLRLPPGDGPFPVVVLVHGGCWLAEYDLGYLSGLAEAITAEGIATWSIEYRRVGEEGGGWPGTFVDVGAATDHLDHLARTLPLDLDRVITVGHSAGGHLALWLAARHGLSTGDPLRGESPLRVAGVLSLAGIPDLAAYSSGEGCGAAVPGLLGGQPAEHPDRLGRTSPIEMPPLGVPQILISGGRDHVVPAFHARNYAAAQAPSQITTFVVDSAGHFELVTPSGAAWKEVRRALRTLVDLTRPSRTTDG